MNWKIIVGILIIFGAVGEFFAEMNDYNSGVTKGNPIIPQFICIAFACNGVIPGV
jgi:hypothetical protein